MKSFFLLVFGLVLPLGLSAVNISSVYFSSCNRENGVIIHVDENRVQMLGLDGAILDIPRYEIIYMSYYPLGEALKVPEMKEPTESKLYTIKTLHNGEVVDLVIKVKRMQLLVESVLLGLTDMLLMHLMNVDLNLIW